MIITGRNEVVAKVMFLQVCVCPRGGGGCLPQCMLGCQTPPPGTRQTPPGPGRPPPPRNQADTPPGPGRHPPGTRQTTPPRTRQTPPTPPGPGRHPHPPDQADSSIRSTSGRYASYWNAFLLEGQSVDLFVRYVILCARM